MKPLAIAGALLLTQAVAVHAQTITCNAPQKPMMDVELLLGRGGKPDARWRIFLAREVTPRFPDGLTVWEATGQWRAPTGSIDREQSKVLLLVHADNPTARQSVQSVIDTYRKAFDQQSVLWESSRVCVAG